MIQTEQEFEHLAASRGWKLCNCAGCGKVLSSQARGNRRVAGRIEHRPFCRSCLEPAKRRR